MFKSRIIYTLSYLYLFIPISIFLLAWIKPIISIPFVLLLAYYLFLSVRHMPKFSLKISENKKKLCIVTGIILLWVWLSGVGGFAWQNIWDHMFRNALFSDLMNYEWPVINTDDESPFLLCYYFGFWLPAALVGKIFNSIEIGYTIQFIWALFGVILTYLLISEKLKKFKIATLLIFIFFSGLDLIIYILNVRGNLHVAIDYLMQFELMEMFSLYFNASSNTTLLFWLYNQAIPFWIGFMLILLQKDRKYLYLTYALLLLYSPLPAMGLIPVIIYMEFKNYKWKDSDAKSSIVRFFKTFFTVENILGLLLILLIASFFKTNISANKFTLTIFSATNAWEYFGRLILFLIFEYGVYIYFFKDRIKKDVIFHILFWSMFVMSFFKLGTIYDFAWRTAIPSAFYLMFIMMEEIPKMDKKTIRYRLFVIAFLIGCVTPAAEILRSIKFTTIHLVEDKPLRRGGLDSAFTPNPCYENFIGQSDSFFFKYLMNKPDELKESKEK